MLQSNPKHTIYTVVIPGTTRIPQMTACRLSHIAKPEFSSFHSSTTPTTFLRPTSFAGIDLSSSLLFRRLAVFTCPETHTRSQSEKYPRKARFASPFASPLFDSPLFHRVRCSLRGYFGPISSLCEFVFFLEESILPSVPEKHSISLLVDSF